MSHQTASFNYRAGPVLYTFAKNWWLLFLRGVAAIVFGVLVFVWPGLTLFTLVILYGAYAFADGIFSLGAAIAGRGGGVPTWWLVVTGLVGIAAGLITFVWPGLTVLLLIMFIGVWAVVHGVFEIVGAIELRKEIENEWLLILFGAISVLFGAALLLRPDAGALAFLWVIGAYAIVIGVLMVMLSLRLRAYRVAT